MNDRAAFLAAIIAEPENDLPRLIYADYLDEHGEVERAEFIRVQCRIAELERDCLCVSCVRKRGGGQHHNGPCSVDKERVDNPDGTSKQAFLRRRERELLTPVNAAFWAADLPCPGCEEDGTVWHRGFVSEITCPWSDWQRLASAIMAATPLRKVRWISTIPPEYQTCTHYDEYPGIEFER